MKNKFDALKQFQSWPREWQELCAEYWAESDENGPIVALPKPDEPFPFDQPNPAPKVAARKPVRNFMRYTRDEITEIGELLASGKRPLEAARIMRRNHPMQRTLDSWEKMVHKVKKNGLETMLEQSVDVEFR